MGNRIMATDQAQANCTRTTSDETAALEQIVVRKRRELWLLDATRIHLDLVEDLGAFVELETVAAADAGGAERAEHDRIAAALALDPGATVHGSYIDLVEAAAALSGR